MIFLSLVTPRHIASEKLAEPIVSPLSSVSREGNPIALSLRPFLWGNATQILLYFYYGHE